MDFPCQANGIFTIRINFTFGVNPDELSTNLNDLFWITHFQVVHGTHTLTNVFLKGSQTFGCYFQTSSNHIPSTRDATYKISYQTNHQKPRYKLINFL